MRGGPKFTLPLPPGTTAPETDRSVGRAYVREALVHRLTLPLPSIYHPPPCAAQTMEKKGTP